MPVSNVHRIRSKVPDPELHTTRLVGNGWTWECNCGARGAYSYHRYEAVVAAKTHKLAEHGVR